MFIVFETVEYVNGERSAQLCGTFNTFEDAHRLMYELYHDELESDELYDEEWCEVEDDCAVVRGETEFPRVIFWYLFDSDNPKQINW